MSSVVEAPSTGESIRYRPVLLAISVATCGVLPAFLTGRLAVQIRDELNFGEGALGLAVAVFFASSALASVFFGRVVERIGFSLGMRLAALTSAVTLFGVAVFARSFSALIFCLVLGGLSNATAHPATHLFLARKIPQERQGLAFGVKQAAIPTATLLAGLAVPILATTVGWRWAFASAAALALVIALLIPKGRMKVNSSPNVMRNGDARLAPLVLLALGMALGSAAANPLGAFIVESSVAAGLQVGVAGLLLALGSAAGIGVRVMVGWITDRRQRGSLNLVAGMLIIGTIGFLLLASGAQWLLLIGTLLAFAAGWGWPGLFNFAVVKTSPGAPAAATGITQTGASGGRRRTAHLRVRGGGLLLRCGMAALWRLCTPSSGSDTRRASHSPARPRRIVATYYVKYRARRSEGRQQSAS